jgi:hypothetical protein
MVEPMKQTIAVGEIVSFVLNTGQASEGIVVDRIAERKQPVILLIEQANGWRCFRFEDEVNTPDSAAVELATVESATT